LTLDRARGAEREYAGLTDHPFPTCFVCGPRRDDGLALQPGSVGDGRSACTWTPQDDDPVMVWAALDCPGGWAADLPGRPMVLGRMALQLHGPVTAGQAHVIGGWVLGEDGRKVHTGSVLWAPDGTVVAVARATWLTVDPATVGA
jgi:hypothetical protein